MTLSELKFLNRPEGEKLLSLLRSLDEESRYKRLFKAAPADRSQMAAAISLLALRHQAEEKFSLAQKMFFSPLSLEQSSGEKIATHIASRFKKDWLVADLTCGAGGNLLALSACCRKVLAVEQDEAVLECARLNVAAYGFSDKVDFFCQKAEDFLHLKESAGIDAVFLDPARDRDGLSKTRSILNSRPNLLEILPLIFKKTKNVGVKISPAFDWREIALLPEEPEVEVISEDNVCKVAMLWFGDLKKGQRSAACFRKNGDFFFSDHGDFGTTKLDQLAVTEISPVPLKYIFVADKALSRAGLLEAFAVSNNLKKLAIGSPYLSASEIKNHCGRILLFEKFFSTSLNALKKELKKKGILRADISAKKYLLSPEEIRQKLKLKEGGDWVLIFVLFPSGKKGVFLAKKLSLC